MEYQREELMAIARLFTCRGWTADQYDLLIKTIDTRRGFGGRAWTGNLFHWAALTEDGLLAVDVSESREAADNLAQEVLGPVVAELSLPMPVITEYEVHNYLTR
jgi:hypothetical protein